MRRYYFNVLREDYSEIDSIHIPDGSSKQSALNLARRLVKEYGIKDAFYLEVNSMVTSNLLDIIEL